MPAMLKIVATNNDSTLVEPAAALKVVATDDDYTLVEHRSKRSRRRMKNEEDKVKIDLEDRSSEDKFNIEDRSSFRGLIERGVLKFDRQPRGENTCGLKMINNATQSPGLIEMPHGQAAIKVLHELADQDPEPEKARDILLQSDPLGDDTGNFHVQVLELC